MDWLFPGETLARVRKRCSIDSNLCENLAEPVDEVLVSQGAGVRDAVDPRKLMKVARISNNLANGGYVVDRVDPKEL